MNPESNYSPYTVGTITKILQEESFEIEGQRYYLQEVAVRVPNQTEELQIVVGSEYQPLTAAQRLKPGSQVIVTPTQLDLTVGEEPASVPIEPTWAVADVYRLPTLAFLTFGFVALILVVARWQGLRALLGMIMSLAVLFGFTLPQLIAGQSPVVISLITAAGIGVSTIYLSHGWNLKSHLSLATIMLTLLAVVGLAQSAISAAQFVGLGSEEAAFLQFGSTSQINLQGLLLAGIILGALGVLDDIVISQISVVQQLLLTKKNQEFGDVYQKALSVGKDHVASLVNTLVLAYAGANLPLFLLFYLNQAAPIWVSINNELIAEELLRTLAGSIGLVLAVPIATLVASWVWTRWPKALPHTEVSHHHH